MSPKVKPQGHLDDNIIQDEELEKMLEERQELKESVSAYRKLDAEIKDKIRSIEAPTPYRVGRFVIDKQEIPGRSVAFEIQSSFRFSIKLTGEE